MNLHTLPLSDLLHPTLLLQIRTGQDLSQSIQIPALIDTGFDGYLSVPVYFAQELNLEILGETEVELANGQQYTVKIALLRIEFDKYLIEVETILGEDQEALIGTSLLNQISDKFILNFKERQIELLVKDL